MLSNLLHDIKFGARMLLKTPAMTAVIVVTLAVGIGFNGAIFSLANTIILNDVPVEEPDRLAFVQSMDMPRGEHDLQVTYPDFVEFQAARSFDELAALDPISINLGDEHEAPQRLVGARVSASVFDVLGVDPLVGRRLAEDDAEPGGAPVALIGYGVWQTRYGGSREVIGTTIRINGDAHVVVGVLPERLDQTPFWSEVWVPLVRTQARRERPGVRVLSVVGRLAEGSDHLAADAELKQLAARLADAYPEDNEGISVAVLTFSQAFTEDSNRVIMLIMLGAVGLLLLIACANVANLLIARAVDRAAEVSVRAAIGASRRRLVQQMLIESLLLSALGGLAAVFLARWGARALESAIMLADPPAFWDFSVQPSVYLFIVALAGLTSLVFGLAPALHATRGDTTAVLRDGDRGNTGSSARRITGGLVVVQLALAVILLTSAGVMIRSTGNIRSVDWAIDPHDVMTMRLTLPAADYPERDQIVAFHDELRERIAGRRDVQGYALTSNFPSGGGYTVHAQIESLATADDRTGQTLQQVIVGPGYFEMSRTAPTRGRLFSDADVYEGELVVVVEQRTVDRFWPDEDPVGQRLRWIDQQETRWMTVVGVVPDIKQTVSLQFTGDYPVVYTSYRQEPLRGIGVLVRSAMDPEALADLLRSEVQRIDANLPVFEIATLQRVIDQRSAGFRIISVLFLLLGGIALFLSCIGIYAVMAFAVGRRQQEIGIRVALGAGRREVLTLVLRRSLVQTLVGLGIGFVVALGATRTLGMYLYEVGPNDPAVFAVALIVLAATAMIASFVPARRAGLIDPLEALRSQ